MRSVRQPSRRRSRACLFVLCAAVFFAGGRLAPASAEDAEHWLTPSRPALNSETLFEAGVEPGDTTRASAARADLSREGAVLYGVHCATCHGADLKGSPGVPSLEEAGGAATDFYITTGRMPLANKASNVAAPTPPNGRVMASGTQAYHVPSLFDARQTAALETYVDAHAVKAITIPHVRLDATKLQRGRRLFEDNCQACHGAAAQGATAGQQWTALPLDLASPTQIGEVIRVGPGVMPRFTSAQLSNDDVAAVATYVRYLATEPQTYGGTVMGYLGPTAEGAVGAFIGVGFLFWVVYFTGTKADGRRLHELD